MLIKSYEYAKAGVAKRNASPATKPANECAPKRTAIARIRNTFKIAKSAIRQKFRPVRSQPFCPKYTRA